MDKLEAHLHHLRLRPGGRGRRPAVRGHKARRSWSWTTTPRASAGPRPTGFWRCRGDATADEVLEAAGIRAAKGLVAAVGSDAGNIFVTLSARVLNPELLIVARASSDDTVSKLERAGADHVVSPYGIGGKRMATLMLKPLVSDYLEVVTGGGELEFRVEEFELSGECCVDRPVHRGPGGAQAHRGHHPRCAAREHGRVRHQSRLRSRICSPGT